MPLIHNKKDSAFYATQIITTPLECQVFLSLAATFSSTQTRVPI